jgi:hypothetical protein
MQHPDIDAWLASRSERERLDELERKAADAWFDSLNAGQQAAFADFLNEGIEGISHLRMRMVREKRRTP